MRLVGGVKDLTVDKVKAIFAGRIEDLNPNVYHFYKP